MNDRFILFEIVNFIYFKIIKTQKNLFKKLLLSENLSLNFTKIKFPFNSNYSYKARLASRYFIFKKKNQWNKFFKDSEDTESIHRFFWIFYYLNKSNKKKINFIEYLINDWINFYCLKKRHNQFSNEIYTVSERVSNLLKFYLDYKKEIPSYLEPFFFHQAKLIFNNFENFRLSNNNHIINNVRALLIFSYVFNNELYLKRSFEILKKELPNLITSDGFLREGSSHYQLVVTRWIVEIYKFSIKFNNIEVAKLIEKYLPRLIDCSFFFINNNKKLLPLIGDISPDCTPDYLLNYFSNLVKDNLIKNFFYLKNKNSSNKLSVFKLYRSSGWFYFKRFNHEIFFRLNKVEPKNYPGHFHKDIGSFEYYYKNQKVIIDRGRSNYLDLNGARSMDHNLIDINFSNFNKINVFFNKFNVFYNSVYFNNKKKLTQINLLIKVYNKFNNHYFWNRKIFLKKNSIEFLDTIKNFSAYNNINIYFHFNNNFKLILKRNFIKIKNNFLKGKLFIFNNFKKIIIKKNYLSHRYGDKKDNYTIMQSFLIKKNIKNFYQSTKIIWE
jgi:hypothetical protein